MYKPANLRKFITPAIHQKATIVNIYGVDQKTFTNAPQPNLRGEFKQKSSNDVTQNGLIVVNDNITYATWFKSDLESGDRLIINGATFEINGTPENVEERKRYMVCNLERITGGA